MKAVVRIAKFYDVVIHGNNLTSEKLVQMLKSEGYLKDDDMIFSKNVYSDDDEDNTCPLQMAYNSSTHETEYYKPVCPRGYVDCIYDPAYTKASDPEWYKEHYGDMSPSDVISLPGECLDRVKNDPEEHGYCYDDEDK